MPHLTPAVFQQLEVDYYICDPRPGMDRNPDLKQVPVVRMYGVNDAGECTCVTWLHGWLQNCVPAWGMETCTEPLGCLCDV